MKPRRQFPKALTNFGIARVSEMKVNLLVNMAGNGLPVLKTAACVPVTFRVLD